MSAKNIFLLFGYLDNLLLVKTCSFSKKKHYFLKSSKKNQAVSIFEKSDFARNQSYFNIRGMGGLAFCGVSSTPEIFIFIAFLGHFFGLWGFIKAKNFRKIDNFSKKRPIFVFLGCGRILKWPKMTILDLLTHTKLLR